MLVLTRKLQEQIQISGDITVTILRIKGSTVRLGIEAPREVRVMRGELQRKEEMEAAADAGSAPDQAAAPAVGETEGETESLADPQRVRRNAADALRLADLPACPV